MERRSLLLAALGAGMPRPARCAQSARGKLTSRDGRPALESAPGSYLLLEGDADTVGVLKDRRLAGADFEVLGRFLTPQSFRIEPIHTRSLFVHQGGKRLIITYWCALCSIRTYTPGICWCCQQETALDLRETDDK